MKIYKGFTLTLFVTIITSDISSSFTLEGSNGIRTTTDALELQKEGRTASAPELPPLIFPKDTKAYKIVPANETALKILQHIKVTAPPQPSLEKFFSDKPGTVIFRVANMHIDDLPEEFPTDFEENLNEQVENIQPDDLGKPSIELEERFHQQPANLRTHDIFAENIETNTKKLSNGHVAGIVAGILAVLCLIVYIGFLSWRSYIIKRYGKRERLVNEDDYYHCNNSRQIDL